MTTKAINTIAAVSEADWEVPGLPEFTDTPEFTVLAIGAFEALNDCSLEGEALDYFTGAIPDFYNEG